MIDLQKVKDVLYIYKDLHGLQQEKPGMGSVIAELAGAIPKYGDAANIHPKVYASFLANTEVIATLRALKPVVALIYQAIEHSEIHYEDAREFNIAVMVNNVIDAARADNTLLSAFKDTIEYRSQYADKAAATRRKNEELKALEEEAAAQAQQPKPPEAMATEAKPAEAKPAEAKPAEAKPAKGKH
jgi:hypothetical protein